MNTLRLTRIRKISLETFKILNKLLPNYILDLSTNYAFRYQNLSELPRVNKESYGRKSFRYEATHIWNSFQNNLRTTIDFKDFGRVIRTWEGTSSKCSMGTFNLLFYFTCHIFLHFVTFLLLYLSFSCFSFMFQLF